ncbi:hypothetical protein TARUN_4013 [Trichoderma arundinaceum]|uniref:Uncharacterized protein n=1 Tax=Trichoderma arundinaceum TaxID=490622 RepID=A0A395NQC6_TRIAR|nr:hypothetical protein TARUN_4013 [Trichoderma arundinaceum]
MASSTENMYKMKRSGKTPFSRTSFGAAAASSSSSSPLPAGDKTKSQKTPRAGKSNDAPPPLVVSDILPPPATAQVETPVPLPTNMRATTTTATTNAATRPALKQKALAASDRIVQAQKDWEKKKTAAATVIESPGPAHEANGRKSPPSHHVDMARPAKKGESKDASRTLKRAVPTTEAMAGAQGLSEEALLRKMTELNKSSSAFSRARDVRAYSIDSSTSASASAPASPPRQRLRVPPLPDSFIDAMDIEQESTTRTGLQTNADNGTKRAPFPPGKERYDDPEHGGRRPFICPVRECRALTVTMKNMVSHFHGKHNRSLFNDNGDGTFSKVGGYVNEDGTSSPGIIVSRDPLSPGAPPPATPVYSESQKKLLSKISPPVSKPSVAASVAASTPLDTSKRHFRADSNNDGTDMDERTAKRPKTTPVPVPVQAPPLAPPPLPPSPLPLRLSQTPSPSFPAPPPPPPAVNQPSGPHLTETLQYLHRFISPNQQVPSRPDILALSKYGRVRQLPGPWIAFHVDRVLDPLHYACALAYLVGRAEELNPCNRWKGVSRLSDTCVALPSDLPAEARAAFSKTDICVACQYEFCCSRARNECEWATRERSPGLGGQTEEAASQPPHKQAFEDKSNIVILDDDGTDDGMVITSNENAALPPTTKQDHNLPSSNMEYETAHAQGFEEKNPLPATAAAQASAAAQKPSPAEVEDMEEMEDWEIAPGTIMSERTNLNIGFSNAYMSNQHPIRISPGVSFHTITLKPGHPHHWLKEANTTRSCAVASGKITVKMEGEQPFKLGKNGLVVIRPGESCTVSNRLYADAVLHCTTFEDDFESK